MTVIRAICVAAVLALAAPSPSQADSWTEYCYTEYLFMGWALMQRHVCVDYNNGRHRGPWVLYNY